MKRSGNRFPKGNALCSVLRLLPLMIIYCSNHTLLEVQCKKKTKLEKHRHTLPLNAPQNYANRFAIALNSHDSSLMKQLLMSLGDINNMKIIKRFFSPGYKLNLQSTKGRTIEHCPPRSITDSIRACHPDFSVSAYYGGSFPVLEFENVQSYLDYFDEIYASSPDAVFNVLSVRSLQTNEAIIIMVGFSYVSTVIGKNESPCDTKDSIDGSKMDLMRDATVDADGVSTSSQLSLNQVNIRGSVALYLSISTGKLYRIEFFSQLLPTKPPAPANKRVA